MKDYELRKKYLEEDIMHLEFKDAETSFGVAVYLDKKHAKMVNQYLISRLEEGSRVEIEGANNNDSPQNICISPGRISRMLLRINESESLPFYVAKKQKEKSA